MENVIEMLHITKEFPGIIANDDVSLTLHKGEILALLGENGAGKSTLMSILFGLYQPSSGEIRINGEPVKISNPNEAGRLNIGMVHQHFKLIQNFTVLDNIILGVEETHGLVITRTRARQQLKKISQEFGLSVDLDALIQDISVGMQQRVEILKMLYRNNDILIFDEPTAVLTPQEIDELMQIMRSFVKAGKSIIFITHKLNEIKAVADRVVILRKGKVVDTVAVAEATPEELSAKMVGRKVELSLEKHEQDLGEVLLECRNLSVASYHHKGKNALNDVSFSLRQGEILCIAGIEGNGQSALADALTGLTKVKSGSILLGNREITNRSIRYRNMHGLSHIPEDRQKYGLVLDYNLGYNLALKQYFQAPFSKRGFLNSPAIYSHARALIEKFDIRSGRGEFSDTRSMSGGNQQKAIVAREISLDNDVLVAVQPTRGLDVGAIEFIHKQLVAVRDYHKAVLLISLELSEVMNIADRILVIYEGELVGEFNPKTTSSETLGLYMSGHKRGHHYDEV